MCTQQSAFVKTVSSAVVLLMIATMFVVSVDGASFYTEMKMHPDHPLMCYWPEMVDRPLLAGEIVMVKDCLRLMCLPNFRVLGTTCPPLPDASADMDCIELPGNNSLDYPKCCPVQRCVHKSVSNDILNY